MFHLLILLVWVSNAVAQETEQEHFRWSAGLEMRQGVSGWVRTRPTIGVEHSLIRNRVLMNLEMSVLVPWSEISPGARVEHTAGRLASLIGWVPTESALALEVSVGPSVSFYTSRWTAPVDHFGMVVSPGVRTRLTMGPLNTRFRVSLGGCWRTDGLDLTVQVGR